MHIHFQLDLCPGDHQGCSRPNSERQIDHGRRAGYRFFRVVPPTSAPSPVVLGEGEEIVVHLLEHFEKESPLVELAGD